MADSITVGSTDGGKVVTPGLASLRKAFRAMRSNEFDKYMRRVHRRIAEQVVEKSQPGIAAESSTAAAAVAPISSAVGGRIRLDLGAAPNVAGIVFGAHHDQPRVGPTGRTFQGYNQFTQWRGEPYHIWPEVDAMREQIADEHVRAIDQFLDDQGVPR